MTQQDLSIAQYIAGAERNLRSSMMPPGYFAKQTYLQATDVFTATYGRKVWDALNNQTRFWNILRKVQWVLQQVGGSGLTEVTAEVALLQRLARYLLLTFLLIRTLIQHRESWQLTSV